MNTTITTAPRTLDLGGAWELTWAAGPEDSPDYATSGTAINATVPGQVHTDLLAAGLLEDPDVGLREADQLWIGHSRWTYARRFDWDGTAAERTELVADGLDTFATVRLNGQEVAVTADQHIGYRWDVAQMLVRGKNLLEITFGSAWDAAHECEAEVGALPRPYDEPYPFVRKSACNFGWDWGPHYITAGIWQPIRLESWSRTRIVSVRPDTVIDGDAARVSVAVGLEHSGTTSDADVTVTAVLTAPDGSVAARSSVPADATDVVLGLDVADPLLWWPTGLGDQPLYALTVTVDGSGDVLSEEERRIGLRTVVVEEEPDDAGSTWAFVVNGRRVRVRGYNWIPDDPFIAEVTEERLGQRLDQAVDGGANLLRVWGGGYFSTEEFMAGCDERGLMVWHDFLFACAAYDESEAMIDAVTVEAEQAVARLSAHPSLVMWCGGNECVWGMYDWGWPEILDGRPYGAAFYTEVLPGVIARLDPSRPYVPNSPWSGSPDKHPNDRDTGPVHIWEVWNNVDYVHYRDVDPPFVSEMGWCAPPAWSTLRRVVTEGDLVPENPQVAHHMRAGDGMEKLARGLAPYFGTPATAEDWHYLTQVVQARSQAAGAEWLRARERCAGVVIWQLNDCWPVLSWSAVDGDGIEKPVWYALRRAFADRMLTIVPVTSGSTEDPTGPDGLEVVLVNDGLSAWTADVVVRRFALDGTEVGRETIGLTAAPDGTARSVLPAALTVVATDEFLVADTDGLRSTWFFAPDATLAPIEPRFSARAVVDGGSLRVTVHAETLLRDLCLFADRLADPLGVPATQLEVDDMMLTVLAGETATFTVRRRDGGTLAAPADLSDAERFPVLRCVGDTPSSSVPTGEDEAGGGAAR
ncbi:beta-mannosidase [Arthrobacter sp. RIT-PI-e]|uniref:glycoside hydrolase family 2 protein n=1 Tax=Arthrobacter sp. RIT-PI-e TaxID=1681197 RepID=UPI0006768482|nr:beta-mannosidase [Arthrobacter sp. RIT-PI-e]KNC18399.1 beta-mannosidase [Arthrobacter sp. RIT-PI-e]